MYINDNNKKSFRAIVLLDEMIAGGKQFKTIAEGDDKMLEPLFIEMMAKDYLTTKGLYYVPTAKGNEAYELFNKRFQEYLKLYDIFSYVDLTKGEFAFAKFFDFDTDEEWDEYKSDQRFEDLRIAVAIFKKMDPAEVVFMSFINEHRFDTTVGGWQMDLLSDAAWNQIEEICKAALKPEQLGTQDVIEDVIKQGTELMLKLLAEELEQRKEDAANNSNNNGGAQQEVVEEYETVEYYEPYYASPFYVSPFWLIPLFLW